MAKFDVAGLIAALKNVSSSDKIALGEALGFPAAKEKKVSNRTGPTVFNAEVAAIRLEMPELSRQEAMKEASRRRDAASGKSEAVLAQEHAAKEAAKMAYKAKKAASAAPSAASSPAPAKKAAPVAPAAPKKAIKKVSVLEDPLAAAKIAFAEANLCQVQIKGKDYYMTDDDERVVFPIISPWVAGDRIGVYDDEEEDILLD